MTISKPLARNYCALHVVAVSKRKLLWKTSIKAQLPAHQNQSQLAAALKALVELSAGAC